MFVYRCIFLCRSFLIEFYYNLNYVRTFNKLFVMNMRCFSW